MAFTREQVEEFIEALQQDAELRERVRSAILADDFLALPGLVRTLTERVDALTERMDALTERMDALTERMDALTERMDALTERMEAFERRMERVEKRLDDVAGKLGNLDGEVFEMRYPRRAFARLGPAFTQIHVFEPSELARRLDADDILTSEELADLFLVGCVVEATERTTKQRMAFAIEVSRTVDSSEVERAARRAGLLGKAGFENAHGCVDGDQIDSSAKELAARLNVRAFVQKEVSPAA